MVVDQKVEELGSQATNTSAISDPADNMEVGYGEACCSPQYSKASFVGCALAIF
jgi:hypothetical protein